MYRGRPVNFAGERTFQPWQISVYNDNDFIVRKAFEEWAYKISNSDQTSGILEPTKYQADLNVVQLDRNEKQLATYVFKDAYPVAVDGIALSWDSNNQIQEYSVTFQYNYWTAA